MQTEPTPQQVSHARAVIENCNDADALELAFAAVEAADKWCVLPNLARMLADHDEGVAKRVWLNFEDVQ